MIRIRAPKLVGVDIDNTLAIWDGENYRPDERYITLIKQFHKRGHGLVAWSAGGEEWANRVVKEFKLEQYFLASMSKFDWFMDDKQSSEFLPEINRIYLEPDSLKPSSTQQIWNGYKMIWNSSGVSEVKK